jgi:hypothetical protein
VRNFLPTLGDHISRASRFGPYRTSLRSPNLCTSHCVPSHWISACLWRCSCRGAVNHTCACTGVPCPPHCNNLDHSLHHWWLTLVAASPNPPEHHGNLSRSEALSYWHYPPTLHDLCHRCKLPGVHQGIEPSSSCGGHLYYMITLVPGDSRM